MANKNSFVPKLRWEECCAKLILERVFPERFGVLTISDKPDLQNFTLDVGIEVTTAESKAEREMDHPHLIRRELIVGVSLLCARASPHMARADRYSIRQQ